MQQLTIVGNNNLTYMYLYIWTYIHISGSKIMHASKVEELVTKQRHYAF